MKRLLIKGETPFQVSKHNFMVGVCADAYTLQVSVDYDENDATNATWSDYSASISASSGPCMVGPVPSNLYWRLHSNTADVYLMF